MSTAIFTGKVIEIADPPLPVLVPSTDNTGRVYATRRTAATITSQRRLRVVRLSVGDVLTEVDASQKEVEILAGYGGGDCGYGFQIGLEYVIYAYNNSAGRLETGICTRTRPLAEAAEDVKYIRGGVDCSKHGGTPGSDGVSRYSRPERSRHHCRERRAARRGGSQ
jgi:hypothetical protein